MPAICPKCDLRPRHNHKAYCIECNRAYHKQHYQSNREAYLASVRKQTSDPEGLKKHLARLCARKLYPEPQPCEICSSTDKVERHHDNYNQPFDIRWLCQKHHKEISNGES